MSNNTASLLPNSVEDVQVTLYTSSGNPYVLTPELHNITLHESIDNHFLYGYLTLFDSVQVREDLNLVGQERVQIEFTKDDKWIVLDMMMTSVDYKKQQGNTHYIVCYITNQTELLNQVRNVSQSFTGLISQSVAEIHRRYLNYDIDSVQKTQGSFSYIAPMVKPYEAIDQLMKYAYDEFNSPFFLYQTIDDNIMFESLDTMRDRDPVDTFLYAHTTNTEGDAFASMTKTANKNRIYSYEVVKSSDFLSIASENILVSNTEKFDISTKTIQNTLFKYDDISFKSPEEEWYKNIGIEDKLISAEEGAETPPIKANSLAFVGNTNNIVTQNIDVPMQVNANYNERNVFQLHVSMNSHNQVRAGQTIKMLIPSVKSNHPEYDCWDPMYSGIYLVSHVAHHISLTSYTMTAVLIKNKVG